MVVDTRPAGACTFFGRRQTANIAPIVVAPKQCHVVRYPHAVVIVVFYFLVERPHLRDLGYIGVDVIGQNLSLVGDDFFQQLHVGVHIAAANHRFVAIAAHPDSHDALIVLVSLNPLFPEGLESLFVFGVVPLPVSETSPVLGPFRLGTCHRFVVGRSHHNPIFIGQTRIFGVILIERFTPHGRPEIVAAKTQDQFEHVGVHFGVDAAELFISPRPETRLFVVDEYAAIFHGGFAGNMPAGKHVGFGTLAWGNIGPPVPRRDSDRLGKLIDAEYRPAFVAAGNHQRLIDAGNGLSNRGDHKTFPLSFDIGNIQFARGDKAVNHPALSQGTDDDGASGHGTVGRQGGLYSGHAINIRLQIADGTNDTLIVSAIIVKSRRPAGNDEGKSARLCRLADQIDREHRFSAKWNPHRQEHCKPCQECTLYPFKCTGLSAVRTH